MAADPAEENICREIRFSDLEHDYLHHLSQQLPSWFCALDIAVAGPMVNSSARARLQLRESDIATAPVTDYTIDYSIEKMVVKMRKPGRCTKGWKWYWKWRKAQERKQMSY